MKRVFYIFALIGLLALSCGKNEDPIKPIEITVSQNPLSVVPGGSAHLTLTLKGENTALWDPTDATSGARLLLRLYNGLTPENYGIEKMTMREGRFLDVTLHVSENFENTREDFYFVLYIDGYHRAVTEYITIIALEDPARREPYLKSGLPVVYVTTQGWVQKDSWTEGRLRIESSDASLRLGESTISIKGRGNSTWEWPKKPYNIKFESKTAVLGMPKHKRWCLIANFMDRTLSRNALAYTLAAQTSLAWTPRYRFVELVFNGVHQGNYMLCEQIRVDKNRVNIDENGGVLYECDFHWDNVWQWADYHASSSLGAWCPVSIKYPDDDDVTPEIMQKAKKELNDALDVVCTQGNYLRWSKYIDVQSFADYWILYELLTNHELGNPGSVFLHKDPAGVFTMGPVWDFDWGGLSYKTSPWAQHGIMLRDAIWYKKMFQEENFRYYIAQRWVALKPMFEANISFFEEQKQLLKKSAKLNFEMWNPADDASLNGGSIINGDENMTFEDALDLLEKIYKERIAILDKYLPTISNY